jgi:hypothetical protein
LNYGHQDFPIQNQQQEYVGYVRNPCTASLLIKPGSILLSVKIFRIESQEFSVLTHTDYLSKTGAGRFAPDKNPIATFHHLADANHHHMEYSI